MIYSVCLFDYLEKDTARGILKSLWDAVSHGGTLLITNSHPENPTRLWMEWAGDWFLNYKTSSDLFDIASGLESVANAEVSVDDFGVYQYLMIKKS